MHFLKTVYVFVHLNVTYIFVNIQYIILRNKNLRYITSINVIVAWREFWCGNIQSNFVIKITQNFMGAPG